MPDKILVVDDDIGFINAYKRLLRRAGYLSVDIATSGVEAINKIHEMRPDLVVLDINMPGGGGDDVYDLLSMSEETQNTAVVFVSGMDYESVHTSFTFINKDNFFSKPFDPSKLLSKIAQLLDIKKNS